MMSASYTDDFLFPLHSRVITSDAFVDAASRCVPSAVRAFLDNPATARLINVLDSQGRHAAEEAAREGHVYVLELLLQGCDLPAPYNVHQAFHLAASGGHAEAVLFLLTQQAVKIDVNVLNADRQSALHLAAQRGYHKVVKVLLDKATPDPYVREATLGKTPAEMAVDAGADDCVALLNKYEPTWRRHVLQLLIRVISGREKDERYVANQKCRLAQIPFALVHSHVLEALAGRGGGRKEGRDGSSASSMEGSDIDADNFESDDEEDFPQVLNQETKRRKVGGEGGRGGGGGEPMIEQEEEEDAEEGDYVYKGMLRSSQDSNDSFVSSSSGTASGGGEGLVSSHGRGEGGRGRASRKSWVAMKERPLPSHSFHGEPME